MFERDLLRDQVILITGGGTGLGLAMAKRVAGLGAQVFLIGRRDAPLERAVADIAAEGGQADFATCDVRDWAAVEAAVGAAERRFGRVTTLINNAAGNFIARTETLSPTAFSAVVGIVLQGTFHCTLALGRKWIAARQPGTILNIVTTYAESGSAFVVPSACGKAGVLAMTRSLAVEWARYGIRVNAVAPGPFPTQGAWSRLMPFPEQEERLKKVHPMKRVGEHRELADLVAYLVSPFSQYINGECVVIDGGLRLCGAGGFGYLVDMPDEAWEAMAKARS